MILFLLLVLLAIAYAQFFAYRRHKGHSSKFATQMNLVTVRRAAAERYGRMVFWPVIMASVLLLCWLMFLYFELLPTEEREYTPAKEEKGVPGQKGKRKVTGYVTKETKQFGRGPLLPTDPDPELVQAAGRLSLP